MQVARHKAAKAAKQAAPVDQHKLWLLYESLRLEKDYKYIGLKDRISHWSEKGISL